MTAHAADSTMVTGDPGWLERLFLILLDNAIKFTPEGGRISVTVSREDRRVRVAVRDTGIGIAPEALPHVFERFYRADPARASQPHGAGLGLALAKWIADRHDGRIDVSSRIGEGTTFTLTLPARSSAPIAQAGTGPVTRSSGRQARAAGFVASGSR